MEKIFDDNEVYFTFALPEAPVRTTTIIPRVEGGLCLISVGGKEGIYPCADKEAVVKFAQEVSMYSLENGKTQTN